MDSLEDLVLSLLEWSPPRRLMVRGEPMILQICKDVSKDFWHIWRERKDELRAIGLSASKDDETDTFVLKWWREIDEAEDTLPLIESTAPMPPVHSVLPGTFDLGPVTHLLRPFQVPAAATLLAVLQHGRFALDATDTGLGKTYVACAVATLLGINVGVMCPANVVTKWTDTFVDVFGIEPEFVLSFNKLRTGREDLYVTRHEIKRRGKSVTSFSWNLVDQFLLVIDEVHTCANSGSLNSELLQAAINNRHCRVLGLSATVANSPLYMDAIGRGLGLHTGNHYDWAISMGARPGFFGGLEFSSNPGTKGERAMRMIHGMIFPSKGCRLRRAALKDQLPANEVFVELVDVAEISTSKIRDYLKLVDEREMEDIERAEDEGRDVAGFTVTMRERQRLEIYKVICMLEKLETLLDEGKAVVVFLSYTWSITLIESLLPKSARYRKLVGGMTRKQRDKQILDFQTDAASIFLVQMDAGSASIDLHDLCGRPRVSLISPGYSAIKLIQALGRIPRDGTRSASQQFIYFTTEDVDRRAAKLVQAKLDNIQLINDGDLQGGVYIK